MAFEAIGRTLEWEGEAEKEQGRCTSTGNVLVKVNPRFYRPAEVDLLIGDYSKAHQALGWEPKTTLEPLCQSMVEADIKRNQSGFSF